jgi:hypothetical protein
MLDESDELMVGKIHMEVDGDHIATGVRELMPHRK